MTPKFAYLGPNFYTPPKVVATSLLIKFHVNPVEILPENSQKPTF